MMISSILILAREISLAIIARTPRVLIAISLIVILSSPKFDSIVSIDLPSFSLISLI